MFIWLTNPMKIEFICFSLSQYNTIQWNDPLWLYLLFSVSAQSDAMNRECDKFKRRENLAYLFPFVCFLIRWDDTFHLTFEWMQRNICVCLFLYFASLWVCVNIIQHICIEYFDIMASKKVFFAEFRNINYKRKCL